MYYQNWSDRPEVRKGDFAENIVHTYLENKGFIVYKPTTEGAHGFDRLAVKDKEQFVIAEVKAKAKMKKYEATGFDYKHYLEYRSARDKHKIPVFVFFVDEWLGKIYGNWLNELEKPTTEDLEYPNTTLKEGIILFSYSKMRHISDLTDEQVEYLKEHSTRKHSYE